MLTRFRVPLVRFQPPPHLLTCSLQVANKRREETFKKKKRWVDFRLKQASDLDNCLIIHFHSCRRPSGFACLPACHLSRSKGPTDERWDTSPAYFSLFLKLGSFNGRKFVDLCEHLFALSIWQANKLRGVAVCFSVQCFFSFITTFWRGQERMSKPFELLFSRAQTSIKSIFRLHLKMEKKMECRWALSVSQYSIYR